ncbi:DUF5671 domain-containing protein [Schaalia sp. JY-X169]|uniref:DUF5671 domain-containing protein n=1 Tax=Schaalia sp. JY-X169 TaxID=2758572 RepID=UPI0015F35584|nr:DUF5671 domain-containing protein [Schaalia sp. JY-X169]
MIAGVAVAAVLLTALVALVALVARRFTHAKRPLGASDVREFFQYVLLYGLYVIVGIGATELLGRVFGASADSWDTSDSALAQALAFVVIGTPLLVVALWWTSRLQRTKSDQQRSSLYAVYLTVTALTALLVAASAVSPTLTFLLGGVLGNNVAADGGSLATVVVWGAIWLVNWLIAERTLTVTQNTPHLLSGSLIAVLYLVGGFITTVGDSASTLWTGAVVYGTPTAIAGGVGTLLAGVLIWVRYWVSRAQKLERGPLWMIFTLPLGVGGGLVLFLGSISALVWSVLVWFIGNTGTTSATDHFAAAGSQVGAALAGGLVWWYFRTTLGATFSLSSNARRLYLYLMAGLGLGALTFGVATVVFAAIEALSPSVGVGMSPLNTLLMGLVAMGVGAPIWGVFWRRATSLDTSEVRLGDHAQAANPIQASDSTQAGDRTTPPEATRRIYLLLWLWLGAIAAVVSLVSLAVTFFQDLVLGTLGITTIFTGRFALGTLVAAGAVVAYHAAVYRSEYRPEQLDAVEAATPLGVANSDKQHVPSLVGESEGPLTVSSRSEDRRVPGPRSVLVVGSSPRGLANQISRAMEDTVVEEWTDADIFVIPSQSEAVLAFLAQKAGRDVLLVEPGQPEAEADGGELWAYVR